MFWIELLSNHIQYSIFKKRDDAIVTSMLLQSINQLQIQVNYYQNNLIHIGTTKPSGVTKTNRTFVKTKGASTINKSGVGTFHSHYLFLNLDKNWSIRNQEHRPQTQ
jgi:hypothetical protein